MMLTNLARYDRGSLQTDAEITEEGYVKTKAIVTRCGVFFYKNADGTIRKELRHPEDVLVKESLDSMKMIPVVDGHPQEKFVTAENAKRLSVGYTGELVEQDLPYIIANLIVTDRNTVQNIKDKKSNELSLGYTVDLIPDSGIYNGESYEYRQTNIRYNHLALVDQARAGPEAKIKLDGQDAIRILKERQKMSTKRKIKVDNEEFILEEDVAAAIERLMNNHHEFKKSHEDFMGKHNSLKNSHEKMMAERDSLRDKDFHDPEMVHHPLEAEEERKKREFEEEQEEEDEEFEEEEFEEDEIGNNGKEKKDPNDSYGMSSHVRDYENPEKMKNHAVKSPENRKYPNNLPRIVNVDAAEINRRVKNRVKLEKLSEKFLDRKTLCRLDGLSDMEIKMRIITMLQPKCVLHGKSKTYINARFDAAIEDMPKSKAKVVMSSATFNADKYPEKSEKDKANAKNARDNMIRKQKEMYKGGK